MLASTFNDAVMQFLSSKAYALSRPEPPSSLLQIEAFEQANGFRLPSAYKRVAVELGTGAIGFATVFSVGRGENGISAQRGAVPELPPDFVPISDNGCGDFYGFVVRAGVCAPEIYFADHEGGYMLTKTEFADLYEYLVRYAFNAA
jgi:SMI1-KNR4 cell-wall